MWIQKCKFICKMMRVVKNTKKSGGPQVCTHRANNPIDIFKAIVFFTTTNYLSTIIMYLGEVQNDTQRSNRPLLQKKANVLAKFQSNKNTGKVVDLAMTLCPNKDAYTSK